MLPYPASEVLHSAMFPLTRFDSNQLCFDRLDQNDSCYIFGIIYRSYVSRRITAPIQLY